MVVVSKTHVVHLAIKGQKYKISYFPCWRDICLIQLLYTDKVCSWEDNTEKYEHWDNLWERRRGSMVNGVPCIPRQYQFFRLSLVLGSGFRVTNLNCFFPWFLFLSKNLHWVLFRIFFRVKSFEFWTVYFSKLNRCPMILFLEYFLTSPFFPLFGIFLLLSLRNLTRAWKPFYWSIFQSILGIRTLPLSYPPYISGVRTIPSVFYRVFFWKSK